MTKFKAGIILMLIFQSSYAGNPEKEHYIYNSSNNGLLFLTLSGDNSYHLDWIILDTKNNSLSISSYGLIQFEGEILKPSYLLSEKIVKNSIKISNGEVRKAPIDQYADMHLDKKSKKLIFYGEELSPRSEFSEQKIIALINQHDSWNGEPHTYEQLFK